MVTCSNCGFGENPDVSRFCAQCAAPLQSNGVPTSVGYTVVQTERATVQDLAPVRGQTLAVDTVLQGHYTILNKLSEGGMGAV